MKIGKEKITVKLTREELEAIYKIFGQQIAAKVNNADIGQGIFESLYAKMRDFFGDPE